MAEFAFSSDVSNFLRETQADGMEANECNVLVDVLGAVPAAKPKKLNR